MKWIFTKYIFIVGLSTRVGEHPNRVFLVVNFFFAVRLYNCNDSHFDMSDLHSWLSGQSGVLYQLEIARYDPKSVLLPQWQRRANAF
jgi:hypothetical protein